VWTSSSIWFGRRHHRRARSIPASRSAVPPLVEIAGVRRIALTRPRRQRWPLAEPPCPPGRARVSYLFARGWRKTMADGHRSPLDPTVHPSAYRFGPCCRWKLGPLVRASQRLPPRAQRCWRWAGPALCRPGPSRSGPLAFFLAVL
jgi:hypothetical protein